MLFKCSNLLNLPPLSWICLSILLLLFSVGCSKSTPNEQPIRKDGEGLVTVTGGPVVTRSPCSLNFKFTTGSSGIAHKGSILFIVSPFWGWSYPQIENPELPGFVKVNYEHIRNLDLKIEQGELSFLVITVMKGELKQEDQIEIIYGANPDNGGAARADSYAESAQEFIFETDSDGDGEYKKIKKQPVVEVLPGPPGRLLVTCPSICTLDESCRVNVALMDNAYNYIRKWNGKINISSNGLFERHETKLVTSNSRVEPILAKAIKKGIGRFYVEVFVESTGDHFTSKSNTIQVTESQEKKNIYWGDIHGHSVISDGTGTIEDYYIYARDVSGLDFAALTDHDSWGFRPLQQNIDRYSKVCNQFNQPGSFVTLLAYEWTQWEDGHRNVYTSQDSIRVYDHNDDDYDVPFKLAEALTAGENMIIPHHLGGGPVVHDIGFNDTELMFVAEVASVHGVSEVYGSDRMIYNAQKGKFFRDALQLGHFWGAIAASDSHDGHPGLRTHGMQTRGVMAVFAEELNRNSIFNAIKNRNCYGTTGARIYIDFSINNISMGQIARLGTDDPRKIKALIIGEGFLERVVLIKNGQEIKRFYGDGDLTRIEWLDPEVPNDTDWYYLRVQQMDGEQAFTSPIWIKLL